MHIEFTADRDRGYTRHVLRHATARARRSYHLLGLTPPGPSVPTRAAALAGARRRPVGAAGRTLGATAGTGSGTMTG